MKEFVDKYLVSRDKLDILDVGSFDVNGSYKALFDRDGWSYFGCDLRAGPNVDIVLKSEFDWGIDKKFDVVVSGQCLEHVQDVKNWFQRIDDVLIEGGIVCIIAPWGGGEHRFPLDCWRVFPDGMRYMLKDVCKFKVLETRICRRDCIGIAEKRLELEYEV